MRFRARVQPDLSFQSAGETWGHASQSAEVPSEVTLVGKPDGQCDLRQRQSSVTEQVFNMFEASLQQIAVRWLSNRLSEGTCEMVRGKPRHRSESVESYLLVEMRFNVFAYTVCDCG
jgi:hypothetical protein